MKKNNYHEIIKKSRLISRDLSWLNFNHRVLDQANSKHRNLFEKLKFLAISASNLDEFFTIRVGSLYNYIDYDKERIDYSGLREMPFREILLKRVHQFVNTQSQIFKKDLLPEFSKNGFQIIEIDELSDKEKRAVVRHFSNVIFPMLTPMAYDSYHIFPLLQPKTLIVGVVTKNAFDKKKSNRLSFVQIPQNLPSFFEIKRNKQIAFVSIVEIVKWQIHKLYKNMDIISANAFRITRNGDFTLDESDDIEADFVKEVQKKLKSRRTGRVVRLEIEKGYSNWMMKVLKERWDIDQNNIFQFDKVIDYSRLWQIINHPMFKSQIPRLQRTVPPLCCPEDLQNGDIFKTLSKKDILLHHPYNSFEPVLNMLEQAAEDPKVLAIKQTIYRLADESRVTEALVKAAENGKHVSVLVELKARFDEEKNIREAKKLEKAGCYVAYGIGSEKTHTKLLMIVRREGSKVKRYIHLGTGNYNESTTKLYTDISLLSSKNEYANDVSEFFNAITGYSIPVKYKNIITAPKDLRRRLIEFIEREKSHAKAGKKALIVIKINSLEDFEVINKLYDASKQGVKIKLIVRGICCLRPHREKLSENIEVRSIVGEYLEHSRLYYFHNAGKCEIYCGSADIMVRSFDRRVESLFKITDEELKKEAINILVYNLLDNVNAYVMNEDGSYEKLNSKLTPFNIHSEFFNVSKEKMMALQ